MYFAAIFLEVGHIIFSLLPTTQEFSYDNEVLMTVFFFSRKISTTKKTDGRAEKRQRNGSENEGYIPEEPQHTERIPSE